MKNLEGQGCQKKEVGRVWVEQGPPGKPELRPERDCRDLLPLCVNSEMSPHSTLKLLQSPTHLQETSPDRKKHKLPCLLLPLYTAIYMTQSREIKTMPTATLVYVEHGLPPFSQGCECLTRARDSLLSAFQRKAAAQRAFSACRPRSDETAFWHTLSRPLVSGPQGSGQQRTGYCKSKQSSRWGTQAGCQPGSKEIPSHCYTQPKKIIHNCSQRQ